MSLMHLGSFLLGLLVGYIAGRSNLLAGLLGG